MYWRVIGRDRDVVDVDLLAPDEVQQEVERALEERQVDPRRVLGEDGLDALRHADRSAGAGLARRAAGAGARLAARAHALPSAARLVRLVALVAHGFAS